MIRHRALILLCIISAPAIVSAADSIPSITERIAIGAGELSRIGVQALDNPALIGWISTVSLSNLSGSFSRSRQSEAVDRQLGSGYDLFALEAESYIHHRNSTLRGAAGYANGMQRDIVWNETADLPMVYPYIAADSVGGDVKVETYRFSGSYSAQTGRWAWGAALGYDAGLYYRNVDPRPRNVTGLLRLQAGGAATVGRYMCGASVGFDKYKQTCSLQYVDEMSVNQIWHLVGFGAHYHRFAGSGYSRYYSGEAYRVSAEIYPRTGYGATLSARYLRRGLSYILTSLNKLPLASTTDNELTLQAGWLAPGKFHGWAVDATVHLGRRDGAESIFGDASGAVYPQIAALKSYRRTDTRIALRGLWQWRPDSRWLLAIRAATIWQQCRERYAAPDRHINLGALMPQLSVSAWHFFGKWQANVEASGSYTTPLNCSIDLNPDSSTLPGLRRAIEHRYALLSQKHCSLYAGLRLIRQLSRRNALSLSASYKHTDYGKSIAQNDVGVEISFIF